MVKKSQNSLIAAESSFDPQNRYCMFKYPKAVLSTAVNAIDTIMKSNFPQHISESEFYENGYRGSVYNGGQSSSNVIAEVLTILVATAAIMPIALVISACAFIVGAIADGLHKALGSKTEASPPAQSPQCAL